ncbi:uncharacterized protein LOC120141484 isoform X2 [Hibiscus syriacus]|nr:uncharacterized protein LOC120141484 isoform X2 [Hibiscus syriacus]
MPINSIKEVRDDKAEEQLGSGSSARKEVTFDTNLNTYEHVLIDESTDFELHNEEGENKLKAKEENFGKPRVIRGGRDGDVVPVLKPFENLDQWKAVKSKGPTPLKLQKENLRLEQEELQLWGSLDRSFSFNEETSIVAVNSVNLSPC